MPTVPIYDAPQVRPASTPVPQLNVRVPNLLGEAGAAIQEATGTLAGVQARAAHEAAQQLVQEKLNDFQRYRNGWDERISTLEGEKIKNPEFYGGESGESLSAARSRDEEAQYQKIVEGMTPLQRRMFDAHAKPAMEQGRMRTSLHETKQIRKIQLDTKDASIAIAGETAEAAVEANGNFGWEKFDEAVNTARLASRSKSQMLGMDGDLADLAEKDAVASVVKRAAKKLLNRSNSTDAQKLIESYSDLLTPEVRDEFETRAKGVNDSVIARAEANNVLARFTVNETQTMNKEAMVAELERTLGNNPTALSRALEVLNEKISTRQYDWNQANSNVAGDILLNLAQRTKGMNALLDDVINAPIPKAKKEQFMEHIRGTFRRDMIEQKQLAGLARQEKQEAADVALATLLLNPDRVAAMSNEEVIGLGPVLGERNLLRLVGEKNQMREQAQRVGKFDQKQILGYAIDLGWADKSGKAIPGTAEESGAAMEEIHRRADAEQQKLQRPLTAVERAQVVRDVMAPVRAKVPRPLLPWDTETTGPAYRFSAAEQDKAIPPELAAEFDAAVVRDLGWSPAEILRLRANKPAMWRQMLFEWERKGKKVNSVR
jgi:hypothetical protein